MQEFYKTTDLGTIAVLEMLGFQAREYESDGKSKVAVYDNTQELERVVADYLNKNLKVDAYSYNQAIRDTKYKLLNAV